MNKTIWIIHQYASTPETGMGGRHYYLANELGKLGYNVYVIAAGYTHLLRTPPKTDEFFHFDKQKHFTFVWVKMPHYENAHSKKRVLNWFLFPWRIQKLSGIIPHKPDVILCSSPSPIAFLGAEKLAKKFKATLAFEVRDIWPLTLIELGGYSPIHPFIRLMQWVEDRAYQKSDLVISNLKYSVDHMVARGMSPDKFHWIPNGVSVEEIAQSAPLNIESQKHLPKNKFIVGYTGSFGLANSLETLIDAAALINNKNIAFVLVGGGKEKNALMEKVKSMGLNNTYFLDSIPKVEIQSMLQNFDTCYLGLTKSSLFRFGVSPNKLFDYLYSGKPLIYAIDSGKYTPIKDHSLGVQIEPENSQQLANAILEIYNLSENEKLNISNKARSIVLEQYEYSLLAKKLANTLLKKDQND